MVQIFVCFYVGIRGARRFYEMVVCPLHEDFNFKNQESFINLRSGLLLPPSTNSERIVYKLIEVLSSLSQQMANERTQQQRSSWPKREKNNHTRSQLSVAVLCDHQHVWSNLQTLFGGNRDFELMRI